MNKLIVTTAAIALAAGLASTAFATQNDGGFYVGVKAGYNKMDVDSGPASVSADGATFTANAQKPSKYLANIHVGYLWPVSEQFQLGGQIGISDYGKARYTGTGSTTGELKVNFSSLNLLAVGQWNIEDWFISGRIGVGNFNPNSKGSLVSSGVTDSGLGGNKWQPIAGASLGYFFTDNFSAELAYDHVFGSSYKTDAFVTANKAPTMNSLSIGLSWSF